MQVKGHKLTKYSIFLPLKRHLSVAVIYMYFDMLISIVYVRLNLSGEFNCRHMKVRLFQIDKQLGIQNYVLNSMLFQNKYRVRLVRHLVHHLYQ